MKHLNSMICMLMVTALLSPCIALAGDKEFKVTLSLNETGDNCVWGGGTDGNGDVTVKAKSGSNKIQVKLEGKDGSMRFGSFNGEGSDQMKATGGDKTINIFNANTGPAEVRYDIFTTTTIDGKTKTVACEPKIINR